MRWAKIAVAYPGAGVMVFGLGDGLLEKNIGMRLEVKWYYREFL